MERKPGSPPTAQTQPALGVIEALSAGLDAVLRHPWLLLIPVLLDLFLWVGPRLHAPALYRSFEPALRQMTTQMTTSEARYAAQELNKVVDQFFTHFNLLAWLSVAFVGVPVVSGGIDATLKLVTGLAPVVWPVDSFEGYLLLLVLFTVIGLFVSALYWTVLGDYVRGEKFQIARWLKQSFALWRKLIVLTLIGVLVAALIFVALAQTTPAAEATTVPWAADLDRLAVRVIDAMDDVVIAITAETSPRCATPRGRRCWPGVVLWRDLLPLEEFGRS